MERWAAVIGGREMDGRGTAKAALGDRRNQEEGWARSDKRRTASPTEAAAQFEREGIGVEWSRDGQKGEMEGK